MNLRPLLLCLAILCGLGAMPGAQAAPVPAAAAFVPQRGMWIWHMERLIGDDAALARLFDATAHAGITDLYIYLPLNGYTADDKTLTAFIAAARRHNIAVWGLDGCRCYFKDADGPQKLYATINALIAYNDRVAPEGRFTGFQNISLPHDITGYRAAFHNGIPSSQLDQTGGGVWQKTAAADRQSLLIDWLDIQHGAYDRLKAHGLQAAAAMLSSTESYYGEPMTVTYQGVTDSLGHLMMNYTDDYIVLTYNTDPANAAGRAVAQATYASGLPLAHRPRVFAAIETDTGNGATISYGDTPGKQSQTAVLDDIATIENTLRAQPAFVGVGIHSWEGWQGLEAGRDEKAVGEK